MEGAGNEVWTIVREGLKALPEGERQEVGRICCGHNGAGRQVCLCAGRWEPAFGKSH